jgi:hypothetical protein
MTIIDATEGHYRTTPQSVRVTVQDGGNRIGAFEKWAARFEIGSEFDAVMAHMEANMNCAFGPDACRLVAAEMKAALPAISKETKEPEHTDETKESVENSQCYNYQPHHHRRMQLTRSITCPKTPKTFSIIEI